eukprot:scaffold135_cov249-Pinguiococcus_pyrenoidosus.AAC.1
MDHSDAIFGAVVTYGSPREVYAQLLRFNSNAGGFREPPSHHLQDGPNPASEVQAAGGRLHRSGFSALPDLRSIVRCHHVIDRVAVPILELEDSPVAAEEAQILSRCRLQRGVVAGAARSRSRCFPPLRAAPRTDDTGPRHLGRR